MTAITDTSLTQIVELSQQMLAENTYLGDELEFLEIVHRNANELNKWDVFNMRLPALAEHNHDLLQYLTGIVGYSALLASPKLADHERYTAAQQANFRRLHDLSRQLHWSLDSLILFATHIARPEPEKAKDAGLLDIRGYLLAQANNHVCRQHMQEINVPAQIPLIYANDVRTKLMLRGVFAAALDLVETPRLYLSAYTMLKAVRAKLSIKGAAGKLPQVLELVKLEHVTNQQDGVTQTLIPTDRRQASTTLLDLGLYVATTLANKQGGRIKAEADTDNLVFTLTMPAVPKV